MFKIVKNFLTNKFVGSILIGLVFFAIAYLANPDIFAEYSFQNDPGGTLFYYTALFGAYYLFVFSIWSFLSVIFKNVSSIQEDIEQNRVTPAEKREAISNARSESGGPSAAWEVASIQLRELINTNRKQIANIYYLCLFVMFIGFVLIVSAILLAFIHPDDISPAVVAGIGGVLTEFIGGTFLFIYRSALEQSRYYIQTLDKTSSVGVALKILEGVEKQGQDVKEVREARIEIAKLIISAQRKE